LLAVLLLSIVVTLLLFGSRFVNALFRESDIMRVHQEVQSIQYGIVNEIRNSVDIIHISSDTLMLSTLDLPAGKAGFVSADEANDVFDTAINADLFVKYSRLTYRLVNVNGSTYLERSLRSSGGVTTKSKLLANRLRPPVEGTASTYIFTPINPMTPPYQYVRVKFVVTGGFMRLTPRTYAVETARRSRL
jgi:hypothetical protein